MTAPDATAVSGHRVPADGGPRTIIAATGASTALIQDEHLTVFHVTCDPVASALAASAPPAPR